MELLPGLGDMQKGVEQAENIAEILVEKFDYRVGFRVRKPISDTT
jgi:hypothetical protein